MKRSSSPGNDDGPAQKRHPDTSKQKLDTSKKFYDKVRTRGTVIWSGTVEIPDSQKIVLDCSIKVFPQDEEIKSLFPRKQLTMRILPLSVVESLSPHKILSGLIRLILCKDENTDMSYMYSAFSQATGLDRLVVGCTVLGNSASVLHLLFVYSFSSGHEHYITGYIRPYQANDTVLGILRSHGLLPCANLEHVLAKENARLKEELQSKEKILAEKELKERELIEKQNSENDIQMADLIRQLQNWQHERQVLAKENARLKEELQSKEKILAEKELKEREWIEKQNSENDIPMADPIRQLQNWQHERQLLAQEQATMRKDVQLKDSMLQERETELTNMKMELEEMNKQIVEKDEVLKKGQHKYKALLEKNTKLNEELQFKDRDLVEQQGLHQVLVEMIEEKEEEIVGLRQKVEEREEKLTRMENEIEELKKQIKVLPKKNARLKEELQHKDKILIQQQDLHHKEVEILKMKMAQKTEECEEERNIVEEQIAKRDRKIIMLQMQMREVQCGKREIVTDILEEFTCSVCKNTLIKACGLPNCGHMFCAYCIDEWLQENTLCPLCRSEGGSPIECLVFDRFIENLIDHLGNEDKQKRIKAVKDHEERTRGRRLLEARVPEHSGRVSELHPSRESLSDSSDEESSSEAEEGEPQCREQEETRTAAFLSTLPTSLPLSSSSEDESM